MLRTILSLRPFRQRLNRRPERYQIMCQQCAYAEDFEVQDGVIVAWRNAQGEMTAIPRDIHALPMVCPTCGNRLRKRRLPI